MWMLGTGKSLARRTGGPSLATVLSRQSSGTKSIFAEVPFRSISGCVF
jgi:hypothetical protein